MSKARLLHLHVCHVCTAAAAGALLLQRSWASSRAVNLCCGLPRFHGLKGHVTLLVVRVCRGYSCIQQSQTFRRRLLARFASVLHAMYAEGGAYIQNSRDLRHCSSTAV